MTPAAAIAVACLLAAIVVAIAIAAWRLSRAIQIDWVRLEHYRHAWFSAPVGFDWTRLVPAMHRAESELAEFTTWTPEQVAFVLDDVRVLVRPDSTWIDGWGRSVGGVQSGGAVEVGSDLSALCHELAHVCQLRINGTTDPLHATWGECGIWAADNAFRAWLAAR